MGLLDGLTPPGVMLTPSRPAPTPLPGVMAAGPLYGARPSGLPPVPRARRSILDRLMPVPKGLQGLLGDDDVHGARTNALLALGTSLLDAGGPHVGQPAPNLGQALAHGLQDGLGAYREGLQGAAQTNIGTMDLQQKLEQRMQQEAFRKRAQALIRPGMTQEQQFTAWQQLAAEAAATGVDLGPLSQMVNATKPPAPPKPQPMQEIRLGNKVILRDPATGKIVQEYPIGPSPRDPNAPDTAQQLRTMRQFSMEDNLVGDLTKNTTNEVPLVKKLAGARQELPAALAGDGAAQVNILYAFVNAMDPASAVREGEIGLAESAASLRARAAQVIQKYVGTGKSGGVPAVMLRQMGALMARREGMARDWISSQQQQLRARGARYGIDPTAFDIVGLPAAAPAARPAITTGTNPLMHP
jgi:hypothetical protein